MKPITKSQRQYTHDHKNKVNYALPWNLNTCALVIENKVCMILGLRWSSSNWDTHIWRHYFLYYKEKWVYSKIKEILMITYVNVNHQRGAFCQFIFRWVYHYGSNKYTGKETGKTHLCAEGYLDGPLKRRLNLWVLRPSLQNISHGLLFLIVK